MGRAPGSRIVRDLKQSLFCVAALLYLSETLRSLVGGLHELSLDSA
jgi:hypothetical protein